MNPELMTRLRTIVKDVTGKNHAVSPPRLVLDVLEPEHVAEFLQAIEEEFDVELLEFFVDEETTFREVIEFLQES